VAVRAVIAVAVLVIAGALAIAYSHRQAEPGLSLHSGTVLPQPRPLPEFTLLDQHARPISRALLDGRWTLLFAGFTHCPDICPATLGTLATLEARLGDAGGRLQMVFLSLDPERDDPGTLAPYLAYFSPGLVGITGAPGEIDSLAAAIGLTYLRVPYGDDYSIDHPAALVLIDPRARAVAYFGPPHHPDQLAADLAPVIGNRP
jgi:protein SCO1